MEHWELPWLEIDDGKILNLDEVFVGIPYEKGAMYTGDYSRDRLVNLSENSAFVYDHKIYWGVIKINEFGGAYTQKIVQLQPTEHSKSKVVGLMSKYWLGSVGSPNTASLSNG